MASLFEGLNFLPGGIGGSLILFRNILIGLLIFVVVGVVVGVIVFRKVQKRKYNIPLIIITPRSDGRVVEINNGVGGYFKSKRVGGITSFRVKRPGVGVTEIPPPNSSFLSSPHRTLILAQKGVDDYEPVSPDSLAYVTTPEEEKVLILNMRAMNQEATAWQCDNAESAKKRFTFISLWEKYQVMITLMMFVFILFLILYINWIGMKDVVIGLSDVAESLKGIKSSAPVITSGG